MITPQAKNYKPGKLTREMARQPHQKRVDISSLFQVRPADALETLVYTAYCSKPQKPNPTFTPGQK
ncbi:MAG TPA: hypothetical protein VFF28_06070 [Candidatus Nanoarchaeia archaeon]|nr:hypothetical protein [Candidatus Nanoarchaeia archaeon]